MNEMIERMARAIYEANRDAANPDQPALNQRSFDDLHGAHREVIKDIARAAIAAMREPSPEMHEEMLRLTKHAGLSRGAKIRAHRDYNDLFNIYQKLIDIALSD